MAERQAFRPDIEGLRGIAILLVVLFHAGVVGLSGGFVGVDVFFVLSGFFITGLLARELSSNGSVDLTAFYGRRALRLLPALLLTLLVTLAAVMWLYAPIDRAAIAANARSVALYSGNIELARSSTDYFGAGDNPLLHTWSLAVEEQFYLAWPLLFLLVARKRLFLAIAIAGSLSLVASLWLTRAAQPWAFFGMPTRIWEFALGGALALGWNEPTYETDGRATILQLAGLAGIALAVATYDRATSYPGVAAVLPAMATVALIVGGQRAPASFVSRALSADWLRWLGRMSYAWYLWHWPLVGVGAVLDWEIGVWGRLAWSAVALVLAWLTHRFIEQPARDGGRLSRIPTRWLVPVALGASVVTAVAAHGAMIASQRQAAHPTAATVCRGARGPDAARLLGDDHRGAKRPVRVRRPELGDDVGAAWRFARRALARSARPCGTGARFQGDRDGEGRLPRPGHAGAHAATSQTVVPRVHALS